MNGNYLITTDSWFIAPDGKQYRAVYGDVKIVSDEILGIKTNVRTSNWFAKVGTEDNHVIIAGCQIHYAIKSTEVLNEDSVYENMDLGGNYSRVCKDNPIYFAIDGK
jgi:hypothetical protein